ncbi:ABC transporter ATP-binding protein [Desulfococcaceae bacterium OttesenSCG-928-F15]|nr:ABC transporter ATP-binding protein [Desulfococcaceae bacterium OttesenSCG-928-F15]
MNQAIVFKNVHKTYTRELGSPKEKALNGVSFSVQDGETIGLIGANGAGKSTCIRLMMNFIKPDEGTILVRGKNPSKSRIRQEIGYLPEVASFPQSLTVLDMLTFTGRTFGIPKKELSERSEKWLTILNLWHARKRSIRTYSKGMQQRAAFTLALVHNPSLLILDEPMSGLDPIGRAQITKLIEDLRAEGKTILLCTHLLEDVTRLTDRILILHKGEKRFEGRAENLSETYGTTSLEEGFLHAIGMGGNHAA